MRKIIGLILVAVLLLQLSPISTASETYLENIEKTNYSTGIGNITYPAIKYRSEESSFAMSLLAGDITGDGISEIIGASLVDNTLFVYNNTLHPLWSFKDIRGENWTSLHALKITSIALGDLDGDGISDVLFSISPALTSIDSPIVIEHPEAVLYAFKGDGTELWNKTFPGAITQDALEIYDMDNDGKNEILIGADNLYLLHANGTVFSTYNLDNYSFRGISEIAAHGEEVVFTLWNFSSPQKSYSDYFRVYNAYFTAIKVSFDGSSFKSLWVKSLEQDKGLLSQRFYRMFPDSTFRRAYIIESKTSALACIDLSSGETLWENKLVSPAGLGIAVSGNTIFVNQGDKISILDSNGQTEVSTNVYSRSTSPEMARFTISVFDIDNDGQHEILLTDKKGLICFSEDGKEKWNVSLWNSWNGGYAYATPPLLHNDIDNDGFDELITTDPAGYIVIIDSGTAPAPPRGEPSTSQILWIAGAVAMLMVVVFAVWLKRRRKTAREKDIKREENPGYDKSG